MADYYCATNGNDGNAGTQLSPFRTPAKLAATVGPGDRGFLRRGDVWTYGTHGSSGFRLTTQSGTSEGTRIIFDAYGTGDLPTMDAQWWNFGDYAHIITAGSYTTIRNLRGRHAGGGVPAGTQEPYPTVNRPGTLGGSHIMRSHRQQHVRFENCEAIGAYGAGVYHSQALGVNNNDMRITGCYAHNVSRANLYDSSALRHNWPVAIFHNLMYQGVHTETHFALSENCLVDRVFGEGMNGAKGVKNVFTRNNEIFAAKRVGLYYDVTRGEISRNIVYGTTDSRYGSNGYSGAGLDTHSEGVNVGSTADSKAAEAHGPTDCFLNLAAFTAAGLKFGAAHLETTLQGHKWQHNTLVDNKVSFHRSTIVTLGTGNFARNNISMPIASDSDHVGSEPPAGIYSSNYFYTGTKAAPTGNVRGAGDRTGTTPVLAKMTNWKTLASVGAITPLNFKPTTRVTTTNLSYDKDFFNDAVTMDEFGAILSGSTAPPPATQKWRYFEVRAVNAAGNGEWSDRIYAATEEV